VLAACPFLKPTLQREWRWQSLDGRGSAVPVNRDHVLYLERRGQARATLVR
jgi:hypothetical protein